jgi:diguanylate cyclase (GGDEF)-like protein
MGEITNTALLIAEAALYFVAMGALFRVRGRVGIGVFFTALGTMHFLETYLAAVLYVPILGGFVVSPGSIVLFSGKLVMLLMVYIREDASVVRQPIYGLFLGNLLIVAAVLLLRMHVPVAAVPGQAPNLAFLDQTGWLMVWGTALLFVDSILIILLYERTNGWFGNRVILRILFSAAAVLTFDQIGFYTALWAYVGAPPEVLYGGWIAKMGAAVIYAVFAGLYLRYGEIGRLPHRRVIDVFETLTYRERYEALLRQTGYDALTGLFDRGRFDREAPRELRESGEAQPASLLVIDVDHFKDINDRYGHAVGDDALRHIAHELETATRSGDSVYRYGGEEFIVLCQGLPHAAAVLAAERLRLGISSLSIDGVDGPITVSIGVATAPGDGVDVRSLFATADRRLYKAKADGRDCVRGTDRPSDISPARPATGRH